MGVARTTITAIYESARRKIAECLVDGKILQIEGGNYRLSEQNQAEVEPKGEEEMRVAVTYDNGEVFQHFGRTETFKLYDIEDGRVMQEQVIETNGTGHGALAGFLKTAGADVLICGGLGQGAKNALAEAGIKIYAGASGNTDATVRNFIAGTLSEKGEATCDHHGHGEHEYHDCGHHDHGDHGCGHGGHCHH
jgi:predicted Fe-Mo cluster-binding NifX family protein